MLQEKPSAPKENIQHFMISHFFISPIRIQIRTLSRAHVVILMFVRKRVYQVAIKNLSIFESAMCTNKRRQKSTHEILMWPTGNQENTKKTWIFWQRQNQLQEYFLCIRSLISVRRTILYMPEILQKEHYVRRRRLFRSLTKMWRYMCSKYWQDIRIINFKVPPF